MTRIVPVIMSGGSGTRLWPLSRTAHPKQLHALVSDRTMLQETVSRVAGAAGDYRFEPPVIVLNERQHDLARLQLDALGDGAARLVVEPAGRNTAPVAAVAADLVRREHGADTLILLLPADHHIRDEAGFRDAVATGARLAGQGHVITFGIQPERPETGYGYIRRGDALEGGYTVRAFTEKPDLERAKGFLADGGYYWNAGIFLFGAGHLVSEMERHCPDVLDASRAAVERATGDAGTLRLDAGAFAACPSISFDYAVMERTDNAAVVPADIGWSDVGAWSALWEIADRDAHGNAVRGDVDLVDTRNTYVLSTGRKVGVIGVDDLVVVETQDAVLVTRRDASQEVKTIVEGLKHQGRTDLL
ncbi:MAG: mannose-1-phosphate guanylyltransferase/mannose-6-phosphate isomerase [Pseudomonadota bacterium]|nr:mannose-1-phosphate guanylyltransferase/mannose-6-phosphate isomerase [Pseudomonadota bacterium]